MRRHRYSPGATLVVTFSLELADFSIFATAQCSSPAGANLDEWERGVSQELHEDAYASLREKVLKFQIAFGALTLG